MPATIYAVRWTKTRDGRTGEFHYADRRQAEKIARRLRRGWRRDAHVVAVTCDRPGIDRAGNTY